jgi:hypothetical protein
MKDFISSVTIKQVSALQKLTTEHTEYTERVRFMNNKDWPLGAWKKNVHNPMFNER